jgi:hypothetical protein
MRSWKQIAAVGILLLGICIMVWLDISAHVRKNRLLEVLSEERTVVLLPSVTDALLADLKSGDADRMKPWCSYFEMLASSASRLATQSPTVQDAYANYIGKERPGRSNYFNSLVFALRQQAPGLSTNVLLGYLGVPDFTSNAPDGQVLQYEYHFYGRDRLASAVVSNSVVVRIDVYVK